MQGSGWSYDNLNRILTSPGYVYEHDILGNRTWRNRQVSTGGAKYEWDELSRASSIVGTVSGARYEYRADGMRTDKVEGFNLSWQWTDKTHTSGFYDENQSQNLPTTRYYYDGQMAVEDDNTVVSQNEPVVTVMRYGIGARGIDFLAKSVDGGAETKGFPMYDGHGNMIATLSRGASTPYFSVEDLRSYDVWGSVRSGSSTGDPKQRYCANLGHIQDDESGLIYMRARYYEPWSGRFLSEDPKNHGWNWYSYANCNPVAFVDSSGQAAFLASLLVILIEVIIAAAVEIGFQLASGRSLDNLDWASVGVAAGFGLIGGVYGHFVRRAFYMLKTPLHRKAWVEGDFATYFVKMIGIGTSTSLNRNHFAPLFRAMLFGGVGHIAMELYGMYLLAHLEE